MSEIKSKYTSIDKLIKLYNKHNKTTLDFNNLLCNKCTTWLTKPVYLMRSGYNVCNNCAHPKDCIQNISLETLLQSSKYPCKFNTFGCEVYAEDIHNHEKNCPFKEACFCGQIFGSQQAIIEHLQAQHDMTTLQLTKPVAEFIIQDCNKIFQRLLLLEAGETKVIVLIQPAESPKQFQITVGSNMSRSIRYTIKTTCGNNYNMVDGTVTNDFLILDDIKTVNIPADKDVSLFVNVKIYFDNYHTFEPLASVFEAMIKEYECPLCLEAITGDCYQCINGHNICSCCTTRIETCPTCRMDMQEQAINIRHFTAHIQRLCKYSLNGCFLHDQLLEIKKHEKSCPVKLNRCSVDCKDEEEYNNADLLKHMLTIHEMQMITDDWSEVVPGYLSWKGCVFFLRFCLSYDDLSSYDPQKRTLNGLFVSQNVEIITSSVALKDGSKKEASFKYKLEIDVGEYSMTISSNIGKVNTYMLRLNRIMRKTFRTRGVTGAQSSGRHLQEGTKPRALPAGDAKTDYDTRYRSPKLNIIFEEI